MGRTCTNDMDNDAEKGRRGEKRRQGDELTISNKDEKKLDNDIVDQRPWPIGLGRDDCVSRTTG